jgi:uncharacterized membrane protein YjgN (DUF898 family)
MAGHRYHVVYRGKLREGFEPETAARNLVRIFNIAPEKAVKILRSRQAVLRKNLEESAARSTAAVLKKAGLAVSLVKVPTPDPAEEKTTAPAKPPPSGAVPPTAPPPAAIAEPPPTVKVPSRIPLRFHGTGSDYFKIWIVNIILSVLTLGIYSAWAKVRRKQYFYGNTRIDKNSFEYLADPKRILVGRIIVVVVFFTVSGVSELVPIVGPIFSLLFLIIFPWLVVRSLTFNARNSSIRNIRFDFAGTMGQAAKEYILWPLLAALTLGILSPHVYYRQKRFLVENSRYGTAPFSFAATPGDYYRIFLLAAIPILIGVVAFFGIGLLFPPLSFFVILVVYLYLFAYFSVSTTNLLYNSSRLEPHRMEASLRVKEYLVLVLVNSLVTAITLGFYHPWALVRIYRYKIEHLTLRPGGSLEEFAAAEQKQVSAIGEEAGDFFDFDIGL